MRNDSNRSGHVTHDFRLPLRKPSTSIAQRPLLTRLLLAGGAYVFAARAHYASLLSWATPFWLREGACLLVEVEVALGFGYSDRYSDAWVERESEARIQPSVYIHQ